MPSRVAVIVWRDVLVLCDDGRSVVSDYAELFEIGNELHRCHPHGWGLLIIIPPNATPPSDAVRQAINDTLVNAQASLRGVTWAIEADGFQGAMARAVLAGMRFLTSTPYPRNVCTSIDDSLSWLMPLLPGGERRLDDLAELHGFIATRRDALTRFQTSLRSPVPSAE
ncbi:MAG TPA: hypothetical protein VFX59_09340 [Polyangiales bacterium]|nr:hypothetical protein [Polyangiales bacterium]